jgi:hypothetical protein
MDSQGVVDKNVPITFNAQIQKLNDQLDGFAMPSFHGDIRIDSMSLDGIPLMRANTGKSENMTIEQNMSRLTDMAPNSDSPYKSDQNPQHSVISHRLEYTRTEGDVDISEHKRDSRQHKDNPFQDKRSSKAREIAEQAINEMKKSISDGGSLSQPETPWETSTSDRKVQQGYESPSRHYETPRMDVIEEPDINRTDDPQIHNKQLIVYEREELPSHVPKTHPTLHNTGSSFMSDAPLRALLSINVSPNRQSHPQLTDPSDKGASPKSLSDPQNPFKEGSRHTFGLDKSDIEIPKLNYSFDNQDPSQRGSMANSEMLTNINQKIIADNSKNPLDDDKRDQKSVQGVLTFSDSAIGPAPEE